MTHKGSASRTLRVGALARVEGEGAMYVQVRDGRVSLVELNIYEPPRFFEGFLAGRAHSEVPDITARICGICPVAYQMSGCQAIEAACGVTVSEPIACLRRLLYCGEWIGSHALHVYFLHAPDFLGFDGVVDMAAAHRSIVERGLRLKRAGNLIADVVGGRAIHPVNVRVGGFYRAPTRTDLRALLVELTWARDAAEETVAWTAGFEFPDFVHDHEYLSLRQPDHYPIDGGRLVSSGGLDIDINSFEDHVVEEHVAHSTALHAHLVGRDDYLVGPLARYSLNYDRLGARAQQSAERAGLGPVCRNPFRSIVVRSVEMVQACDEAIELIESYQPPDPPFVEVTPRAGRGYGCTEAPRGALYHRYDLAGDGTVLSARIVPPTSQNQAAIEHDMAHFVESRLHLATADLTRQCEHAIRNYDPCISCATHFLDLRIDQQ